MKILFAAAEVDPFAKVGGLADVAAALPERLQEIGHDVRVVMPCHASALEAHRTATERRTLVVPLPNRDRTVDVATVAGTEGVPVDLVLDDSYFGRPNVYGDADDLLRYQFFCRAVLQMLLHDEWMPDVVHINDWHTAPLAYALRNLSWGEPRLRGVASVFTIHNLRYRGPDGFNDFLAQAIYYSDMVTTVSPTYAREILTQDFGEGLDPLLALRDSTGNLAGILNGLNYDTYNPRTDARIRHQYDLNMLEARVQNTAALRREVDLSETGGPLAAMVTRLTEQKGVDLVLQALPEIIAADAQLLVLGTGDRWIEDELGRLQERYPRHLRHVARFDESFARRIYAGADFFLMPSRYEPCGLGQIIAMRYGCVPLGRRTGGLADTIFDFEEYPEIGTGFLFDEFSAFGLIGAFDRAVRAFREPATWMRLQENGMSRDYSWRASATHYVETYVAALRARGIVPLE
ncbi:MAG: glycogen synthase [Tepidiformaceae bacterium]